EDGAIGSLTGVNYRLATLPPANGAWRVSAAESGGGLFLDVGSHVLDFLDFCVGPLEDVRGRAARVGTTAAVEDAVAMTFRTAGGVLGTAAWNFASFVKEDGLEFSGTKGRVAANFFADDPVRLETVRGVETFSLPN